MLHWKNRPSLKSSFKIISVLTLHLLFTHPCRGQSQLIGPSQPIAVTVGNDIILPCHLKPTKDVSELIVEWTRSDLDPKHVHVRRAGQDVTRVKHPSYKERTSLFINELKQGNISLKLSNVTLSDRGKYRCFIPELNRESFVQLVVDESADDVSEVQSSSLPVIIGVAVGLVVCIVVAVSVFFVWKRRKNKTKKGGNENLSSGGDSEMQPLNAAEQEKYKHTPEERKHDDTNMVFKNSSQAPVSVEVNQPAGCIHLNSKEDLELGDWRLRVKVNDEDPIMYKFEKNFRLRAENNKVTLEEKQTETDKLKKEKQDREEEVETLKNKGGMSNPISGDYSQRSDTNQHNDSYQADQNSAKAHQHETKSHKTPEKSKYDNTNLVFKNSSQAPVSVDASISGKYFHLTNQSKQDLKLEDWRLRVKVNDDEPIMYTFEKNFRLSAGKHVCIWVPGNVTPHPPYELVWSNLKRWGTGDKLLVELVNFRGDIVTTT